MDQITDWYTIYVMLVSTNQCAFNLASHFLRCKEPRVRKFYILKDHIRIMLLLAVGYLKLKESLNWSLRRYHFSPISKPIKNGCTTVRKGWVQIRSEAKAPGLWYLRRVWLLESGTRYTTYFSTKLQSILSVLAQYVGMQAVKKNRGRDGIFLPR